MPSLDLFIYREFDSIDVDLDVGDDAEQKLGSGFNGLHVVAIGPPIHETKDYTVVLAAESRPEMMQPLKGFFGPRTDQVVEAAVDVVPTGRVQARGVMDSVGLVTSGRGVSDQTERKRTYILSLEAAQTLAGKLGAVVQHVRQQARPHEGNGA